MPPEFNAAMIGPAQDACQIASVRCLRAHGVLKMTTAERIVEEARFWNPHFGTPLWEAAGRASGEAANETADLAASEAANEAVIEAANEAGRRGSQRDSRLGSRRGSQRGS